MEVSIVFMVRDVLVVVPADHAAPCQAGKCTFSKMAGIFATGLQLRALAHLAVVDFVGLALVVDVDHVRGADLAIGVVAGRSNRNDLGDVQRHAVFVGAGAVVSEGAERGESGAEGEQGNRTFHDRYLIHCG
ncbi:hypothetical protein EMIT047CA2_40324 [Pseudomonas soli]